MEHRERITLDDSVMSAIMKLSEGNPGAVGVLIELSKGDAATDPDSVWGPLSSILSLDTNGIYASGIWILYKDICQQNPLRVRTLLRAVQLGLEPRSILRGKSLTDEQHQALLSKVQAELPAFGRA